MSTSSTGLVSSNGTELIAGASYTNGNGINVSQTVAAIIQADRAPETAWTNDQTKIASQQAALVSLQTELSSLQSAFQSLNDLTGVFSGLTGTSSDSAAVSATASGSAAIGSHNVVVSNVASAGESYSNVVTGSTMSSGSLVITIGSGAAQTINIPEDTAGSGTTTLANAATYINQQNLGVRASVVTDSQGSRLALVSTVMGTSASVAVQSAPSGLTFTNVAGKDASLTVDGVPLTSSTNTISTAITGVTLNLTGTTSVTGATIQIAPDTTQITTAISSFVSSYNAVVSDLNSQFQYNGGVASGSSSASSSSSTSGVLEADPSARLIQGELLSSVAVSGSVTGSTAVTALSQLGITMNNDGTLTLNSSTLQSQLGSNYSAVQNFFQSATTGSFAYSFTSVMTNLNNPADGSIVLDLQGLKQNYSQDQTNIDNLERQLALLKTTLTNQYAALNTTMQMYPSMLLQIDTLLGYRTTTNSNG